jgi:hypothetical protein
MMERDMQTRLERVRPGSEEKKRTMFIGLALRQVDGGEDGDGGRMGNRRE